MVATKELNSQTKSREGKFLIKPFYDVVAELGLNRLRHLTLLKLERASFEFLNHLPSPETAKVSTFFAGRTKGDLLGDG